jgi:hypothetical protein
LSGSEVLIRNEDTGEEWTAIIRDGRYDLEIGVPPGLNRFTATKPHSAGTYLFDIKLREPCQVYDSIRYDGGLAILTVFSDCSIDGDVIVNYTDQKYSKEMESVGSISFKLPLGCGEVIGNLQIPDLPTKEFSTNFDCSGTVRFILRWTDDIDLDLHVQEKFSSKRHGQPYWVSHGNCLKGGSNCIGYGILSKDCQSNACGSLKEEVYEVKMGSLRGNTTGITAMVNYYSRGNNGSDASGDFCGSGSLSSPAYTLIGYIGNERYRFSNGQTIVNASIPSVQCGSKIPDFEYLNPKTMSIPR